MAQEESTYWDDQPTICLRGTAVVGPAPAFPKFWGKALIGTRIEVVQVYISGIEQGGPFAYLDNRDGEGWHKVTVGRGKSSYPHKNLTPVFGTFEAHDFNQAI